jgi:hypothetical protein
LILVRISWLKRDFLELVIHGFVKIDPVLVIVNVLNQINLMITLGLKSVGIAHLRVNIIEVAVDKILYLIKKILCFIK